MKVLVDAYGGDNAPQEIVNGALLALYKYPDLQITLVGKEDPLKDILAQKSYDKTRLNIIPASEVIDCDDSPVSAIRTKKDSSIVVSLDNLKTGEYAGLVSAGSTGAVLSGAVLKLGRINNVSRPALAPLLPTKNGGRVMLIDSGANMDCKPINLCHFALMGSTFMKTMFGIETPRVALLSVGTEDAKGNQLVLDTFGMLKGLDINFVGNMEARDALSGEYDVIVADGFAGNVLLKSMEGALKNMMGVIKQALTSSLKTKLGALLIKKSLKKELKKYDYEQYGGAPLLGTKYLVFKSHGSSKAKQILASIEQIVEYTQKDLLNKIKDTMQNIVVAEEQPQQTAQSQEQTTQEAPAQEVKQEETQQ